MALKFDRDRLPQTGTPQKKWSSMHKDGILMRPPVPCKAARRNAPGDHEMVVIFPWVRQGRLDTQ